MTILKQKRAVDSLYNQTLRDLRNLPKQPVFLNEPDEDRVRDNINILAAKIVGVRLALRDSYIGHDVDLQSTAQLAQEVAEELGVDVDQVTQRVPFIETGVCARLFQYGLERAKLNISQQERPSLPRRARR